MEPFPAKCLGVFSESTWPLASIEYLFVRPAGPNRDRQNSKKQFPLPENGFARMKSLRTSCFDAALEEAERCFRTSGFSDADFNFRPCSEFLAPNILTSQMSVSLSLASFSLKLRPESCLALLRACTWQKRVSRGMLKVFQGCSVLCAAGFGTVSGFASYIREFFREFRIEVGLRVSVILGNRAKKSFRLQSSRRSGFPAHEIKSVPINMRPPSGQGCRPERGG